MVFLDAAIDTALVSEVVNLIKTMATGLFTTFPLNVFVIMGIAGSAIGLIRKGKRAAR